MKNIIKWFGIIAGASLAGVLLPALYCNVADTIRHNRKLERMKEAFSSLRHPAGTARITLKKKVGLLSGNGNHCDYFVGELRSYSGDTNAVGEWYKGLKVKGPDGSLYGLDVLFLKDGDFTDPDAGWRLPYCCDEPSEWGYETESWRKDFYIVFCFLGGFEESGGDWRCR